jgi:hypothetical protein
MVESFDLLWEWALRDGRLKYAARDLLLHGEILSLLLAECFHLLGNAFGPSTMESATRYA